MYVRGFKTQNERLDDDVRTTISDITIFQNCLVLIFGAKFIEQKLKKFKEDHGLHSSVDASYAISGAKKSQT